MCDVALRRWRPLLACVFGYYFLAKCFAFAGFPPRCVSIHLEQGLLDDFVIVFDEMFFFSGIEFLLRGVHMYAPDYLPSSAPP